MRVLMFIIAIAVFALVGCQQAQETAEEVQTEAEEMVEEAMDEMPMLDPVSGEEITEDSEWTAEYEGMTYYFSSEENRDKFLEEPMAFLKDKMGEAEGMMDDAKEKAGDMMEEGHEKVEDMAEELGNT